jgi:ACT domain-containing protein
MKVNLIIPAKEDERNLPRIIKPLLKNKNIGNIILVLHKKNKKKFLTSKKLKIIVQKKTWIWCGY